MHDPTPPLVSAEWLAAHRHDERVIVADVRWYLKGPHRGIDTYQAGHLPGAHFLDLETELAGRPWQGGPGRHPLPAADVFAGALARIGVTPQSIVVAYDDAGGSVAARLWWLLRYFGHDIGRVLDGGIQAWEAAGYALATTAPTARGTPRCPVLSLSPHREMVVDQAEVAAFASAREGVLLDARARERYAGIVEPVDARAGHIPGAASAPFVESLLSPAGPFAPKSAIAERFAALGVRPESPIVAYCGSGVTACHVLLALALVGRADARLYEGSWGDWAANSLRPIETGTGTETETA